MSQQPLPANSDLGKLKNTAKLMRDSVRSGDPDALDLVREFHPRLGRLRPDDEAARRFQLADSQLTLARQYGFTSWPKLRRHVELVRELGRSPHTQPIGRALTSQADQADELLRLACLTYGADHPSRPEGARTLLDRHPELAAVSIHTIAATGHTDGAAAHLDGDPDAANTPGGPFDWPPLLYAVYSRLPDTDTLPVARLLLEAGADPNAGYLWDGLVPPFTALTGALGGGEQGQPPHPRAIELARLLLEAGADANDSQTIYNQGLGDVARDDTDLLELLLEHGFGRGDGGPWKRLLGRAVPTPRELAGEAFQHAVEAGLLRRTRLLLERGADPNGRGLHPVFKNRTAYQGAVLNGNIDIVDMLEAAGADPTTVDQRTRFIGACLAGAGDVVDRLLGAEPDLLSKALQDSPDLIARAAELERPVAVRLLCELGFDVNNRARTTALHQAAFRGNNQLIVTLLELGADPTIEDTEHHSTPQSWAEYAGHTDTGQLLAKAKRRGQIKSN